MRFPDTDTRILITHQHITVTGEILLVSDDQLSMIVRFGTTLGRYEGLMPILWIDNGYVDLFWGKKVLLQPATGSGTISDITQKNMR